MDSESDQENPVDEQTGLVGAHSTGTPAAGTPGWSQGDVFLGKTHGEIRCLWTFLDVQWDLNQQERFFFEYLGNPCNGNGSSVGFNKVFEPAMQNWCIEPGSISVLSCKNGEKTSSNQTWQWKPDFLCKV